MNPKKMPDDSGSNADTQVQSLDERMDILLQDGQLTEFQQMKIMELEGKVIALHHEWTAANKAKEKAKLKAETEAEAKDIEETRHRAEAKNEE